MSAPARAGVVGCGVISRVYAANAAAFDAFELVACADLEPARAAVLAAEHGLVTLELDALLAAKAENWSIGRMPATDRNLLRLGAFEIRYTDTPDRVAIDEAIELAKRFGTANSPQFINGILDKLIER